MRINRQNNVSQGLKNRSLNSKIFRHAIWNHIVRVLIIFVRYIQTAFVGASVETQVWNNDVNSLSLKTTLPSDCAHHQDCLMKLTRCSLGPPRNSPWISSLLWGLYVPQAPNTSSPGPRTPSTYPGRSSKDNRNPRWSSALASVLNDNQAPAPVLEGNHTTPQG